MACPARETPLDWGPANSFAVDCMAGETLLIVDDLPENLDMLGGILRDAGYGVRAANSGAAALRYAAIEPVPALILLDVMMPDMDGYETLRRLRGNHGTRDIPVIFLTALGDVQDVAQGLRLGAADYIAKPFQSDVLLARVRTQIDARIARDWLKEQNAFLEIEVARRVAEARRIEEEAERTRAALSHQRELILASAAEGIFGVNTEGVIDFANPAAESLLGYERGGLLGRKAHDVFSESSGGPYRCEECPVRISCESGVEIRGKEATFRRGDGSLVTLELSCTPIDENGRVAGAVVTLQDVSEHRRYLEQLERKSNFDDLTGLPNRNLLNDRLAHAIERSRKEGGTVAVLMLSFDRFEGINEALGHAASDRVLREVAERLGQCTRKMDTLAHAERGEFVLVAESTVTELVSRFVQPLLALMTKPFEIDGRELFMTGSIGIAVYPRDGENGETLLKNAAAAMYRAKAEGGNRFHFYTTEMNVRLLERLDMENGLRRAIERGELVVHYQPQLSLRTGEIIGVEALVRWQHSERGLVMPGEFISLAEESGLIVPLGEWVLLTACRQNKAWQDAGLPRIKVGVNLSAKQFSAQDMVHLAGTILEKTGLDPNYLELELTESAVMADAEAFVKATEQLKGLSITLSIDDFGTGFSSLSYLKRFSVDRLKIDQSFVREITNDPNSAAIALAIISLSHGLKMLCIAEGVETEAQLNFLRLRDCDEMQGFYFSKALPAEEFEALLRESRKLEFPAASELPERRLLVVDDEPAIIASLKRLFRREGYNVLSAPGGAEALDLLARLEVGVVISDARMPEMSGSEFLGRVRELHPDTVRIMLSGYTDLQAVTSAVNRGEIFRFMTKPWDDAELIETVRDAFRHYESRHVSRPGVEKTS